MRARDLVTKRGTCLGFLSKTRRKYFFISSSISDEEKNYTTIKICKTIFLSVTDATRKRVRTFVPDKACLIFEDKARRLSLKVGHLSLLQI